MKKTSIWTVSAALVFLSHFDVAQAGVYVGVDAGGSRAELNQTHSSALLPIFSSEEHSNDRTDSAFGVHFGYDLSDHFGIELGYLDAGTAEYHIARSIHVAMLPEPMLDPNFEFVDPNSFFVTPIFPGSIFMPSNFASAEPLFTRREVSFHTKVLRLSLLGHYEFTRGLGIFASAGIAEHFVDASGRVWLGTTSPFVEHDRQNVLGGQVAAGLEWAFHPHWSWRIQYERQSGATTDEFEFVERGDVQLLTTGLSYRF